MFKSDIFGKHSRSITLNKLFLCSILETIKTINSSSSSSNFEQFIIANPHIPSNINTLTNYINVNKKIFNQHGWDLIKTSYSNVYGDFNDSLSIQLLSVS